MTPAQISKILSPNDTGETGAHQAGILIPKDFRILEFFPKLDGRTLNPRCHLSFSDDEGCKWEFAYIYYNNALFGGTRNEFRLTRMTRYIRQNDLVAGDEIILSRETDLSYRIKYRGPHQATTTDQFVLKLGSGWKIIQLKGGTL